MKIKKKIVIIICVCMIALLVIGVLYVKNNKANYDSRLEGRWTSVDGTLIKVIKEYKYGQPVYANDNIVEYWLDIKKDGKYILYFNDVADKSRSDYSIEKNLVEKGKYNIDSETENLIYFDPDSSNDVVSYIWKCKINESNKLSDCTNHAYNFTKQVSE